MIGIKNVYKGWLKLIEVGYTDNGKNIKRELCVRPDSVGGVLYDQTKEVIYLVKQKRPSLYNQDDMSIVEVMAGSLEGENDDPLFRFKEEAMEEVGFKVNETKSLGCFYTSPGTISEKIHLFIGYGEKVEKGGGKEDENEFIEILEVPISDINSIEQKDMKTKLVLNLFEDFLNYFFLIIYLLYICSINNTMNMKTFDSGLNIISLDDNNKILKIEDKNVLFFDIEIHPELHECLSCFEDNILNEFILCTPSTIDELVEIVKEQYNYWGVNEVDNITVYDYDGTSLRIGFGFQSNEDYEYMTVISPMITFTLK